MKIPVEFAMGDERLVARYSRKFARRAVWLLLGVTLVAGVLLAYPVRELARLNPDALPLGLFLLAPGSIAAAAAVAGWAHLALFARRDIVFDRRAGTCAIPQWFRAPRVIPLSQIERVVLRRARKERDIDYGTDRAGLWTGYYTERESILLVLRDCPLRSQRLWGRLGLPHGAEPVAERIAEFLGRRLERQPAKHFATGTSHAA